MRIAVQEWLDGGDVTLANCRRAATLGIDLDCAANHLLSAPARKAYNEAMAPARKAYEEAMAPAWKAYEEAMARAWKAYNEARAPAFYAAWKLYANAVIGPLTAASAAGEES